jgi:epoxyqueuosine reductase
MLPRRDEKGASLQMATLTDHLKNRASELGFSMAGVTTAASSPELAAYLSWIKAGMHGAMGYMARPDRVARRQDLTVILPGAHSLLVVGLDYATQQLPDAITEDPARGRISNYAWQADYHDVMLERLETLRVYLLDQAGGNAAARAYVDTGAILERSHAKQAGLGFTGKNTLLIHPRRGSFFFLGEIITDVALTPDLPPKQPMPGCGTCTRCLSACPTDAFPQPYVLDARRCISYLTIELKGVIPRDLRPLMGNWVYGCDVCQDVCPWQRFAQPSPLTEALEPESLDRAAPPLQQLLTLGNNAFATRFSGSPIERIGRDRLVRNACIAAGNSGLDEFTEPLTSLLADPSPLVRAHAAWALGRLPGGHHALRSALSTEPNEEVREEITAAIG